jgi:hypothetical protein
MGRRDGYVSLLPLLAASTLHFTLAMMEGK